MGTPYATETTQTDVRYVNASFLNMLSQGREKQAAEEGSAFIREYVRQEAWTDEIVPPVGLTETEIDRDENTEEPKKIVEKEPKSLASFVPFEGTPEAYWFQGYRYAIFFGKITSQKFAKSKYKLMTHVNDIRKIIADNSVKDMADEKDRKFRNTVMGMININPTVQQTDAGQFTSSAFKLALKALTHRRRPIGKMMMTKELYFEAMDLPATAVGNAIAEQHYREGIENEERLWGIPTVQTIKSDIVDPKEVLIFSPQNFLGNHFVLQDATLHIKQEADIVEWHTYMVLGIGIGNRLSMQRLYFPDGN